MNQGKTINNNSSIGKKNKRSNSLSKNPYGDKTTTVKRSSSRESLKSNNSVKSLGERDWELSCTLDQTTKFLQKTTKTLNNTKM